MSYGKMIYAVEKIRSNSTECPDALQKKDIQTQYPYIWAIGNLNILDRKLLGFFCSVKCPGDIILKTYDFARAMRDKGITVISGFHSAIEKDCLDILIKGTQPIVICPARGIENMRVPKAWKIAIESDRLLVLSPFEKKHNRVTAQLADRRNQMVALRAENLFLPYAVLGSRSENLCNQMVKAGRKVFTFEGEASQTLTALGAKAISIEDAKVAFKNFH